MMGRPRRSPESHDPTEVSRLHSRHGRPSQPRRVLVVEDDASTCTFLTEALVDERYEVRSAGESHAALELLGVWRADLILLALILPDMDGRRFREEQWARADVADIPVILLSATLPSDLEAQAAAL